MTAPTTERTAPRSATLARGALCVLAAGLLWAGFTGRLGAAGHAPSRVLLPVTPADYYLWQSLFVAPLLVALWWLLSMVAFTATGGAQRGPATALAARLGVVYGTTLALLFVGPEWIAFEIGGLDGLRRVVRFTGPALAVVVWSWSTLAIRKERSVSWKTAFGAAGLALFTQGALGALFLR